MSENLVKIEIQDAVGILHLNRPDKLNALSPDMLNAIAEGFEQLDANQSIRVIVIVGSPRVFAAGADIEVMSKASPLDMVELDTRSYWLRFRRINKPIIAAVSGFAFGGGCELAMQCDIIIASESAKFAQPEIKLGIIPGAGGTQRLAKAIGPYKAMELILTGEHISAKQAYEWNLVNRVVPVERYLDEALELARKIAARPEVAIKMAREAVRYGVENTLLAGMELERRNFLLTFDTEDQKEGMAAFLEKRDPNFKGK